MAHRWFLLLLFVSSSFAQVKSGAVPQYSGGSTDRGNSVKVRVSFTNGVGCNSPVRVSLVGNSGVSIAEGFTNGECEVEFANLPSGDYRVVALGKDIESSGGDSLTVDSHGSQSVELKVNSTQQAQNAMAMLPTVGKMELAIPDKARKEFDKANQEIAKEDWKKAMDRLNKAVSIYPNYAEAYNNIGVVYGHLGDRAQERQALQKAVELNDHFAPSYVNLARMDIVDRDFHTAESLLNKAAAINPSDVMTLVLLANMQLMDLHYDDAIASTRKAHSLSQSPHAVAHYVAARAFEAEGRPQDAMAELKTFLGEEQSGARAEAARKEMAALEKSLK